MARWPSRQTATVSPKFADEALSASGWRTSPACAIEDVDPPDARSAPGACDPTPIWTQRPTCVPSQLGAAWSPLRRFRHRDVIHSSISDFASQAGLPADCVAAVWGNRPSRIAIQAKLRLGRIPAAMLRRGSARGDPSGSTASVRRRRGANDVEFHVRELKRALRPLGAPPLAVQSVCRPSSPPPLKTGWRRGPEVADSWKLTRIPQGQYSRQHPGAPGAACALPHPFTLSAETCRIRESSGTSAPAAKRSRRPCDRG